MADKKAKEKAEAELQAKYDGLITAGDQNLSDKSYETAQKKYEEALLLKATEQYPKDKIAEIEALLAEIAKKKGGRRSCKKWLKEKKRVNIKKQLS